MKNTIIEILALLIVGAVFLLLATKGLWLVFLMEKYLTKYVLYLGSGVLFFFALREIYKIIIIIKNKNKTDETKF